MGFHICEYCQEKGRLGETMEYSAFSSADVTLRFESGRIWTFPHEGLLHYVTQHNYRPPQEFIDDVMGSTLASGAFAQTKSISSRVGYLSSPEFPTGAVPREFVQRLAMLVQAARASNDLSLFQQTRGAPDPS